MNGGNSDLALIYRGEKTRYRDGQTSREEFPALRNGKVCRSAAEDTCFNHYHNRGKEAVDALCAGERLDNKELTEKLGVFSDNARRRASSDANAVCGAYTAENSGYRRAENCKNNTF